MASNRVIGNEGGLPWHLPADLRWFKKCTLNHPILMGRRTFESFPALLPRRRHIVLSRSLREAPPGVDLISSPAGLDRLGVEGDTFVIGGARIFEIFLPRCADLFLTWIRSPYPGDTFFPAFEDDFVLSEVLEETPEFEIRHYRNKVLATSPASRER